jgi:hypothetical protein
VATSSGGDDGRAAVEAPAATDVAIPIEGFLTIPAGHRLGVRLILSFIGTAGDTLLYDSTQYPSGLTAFAGRLTQECTSPR